MQGNLHWDPAAWRHDDQRRFQFALGFSVLLHAVLLLGWKISPQLMKTADYAVLTVVLRGAAPAVQSSVAQSDAQRDVAVLTQTAPDPTHFVVKPRAAAPGAASPVALQRLPQPAASSAIVAPQASPGRLSSIRPAAVGVPVLLVIGGDGRVQQILWDRLPALTDEQLRRVEAMIREKTYTPGQTVSEVVDVRAMLKLPTARTEEGGGSQ